MKLIQKISDFFFRIESYLLILLVIVMVLLSFLQVLFRNLFSYGFLWADPLLRYMVMWVGFLGAVLATHQEKHFSIEFLNRFLSPRTFHIIQCGVSIFAMIVAFLLSRAALQFLLQGIEAQEKGLFDLPRRVYFVIIPAGFGLITLHFLFHVIQHLHGIFSKKSLTDNQAEMAG